MHILFICIDRVRKVGHQSYTAVVSARANAKCKVRQKSIKSMHIYNIRIVQEVDDQSGLHSVLSQWKASVKVNQKYAQRTTGSGCIEDQPANQTVSVYLRSNFDPPTAILSMNRVSLCHIVQCYSDDPIHSIVIKRKNPEYVTELSRCRPQTPSKLQHVNSTHAHPAPEPKLFSKTDFLKVSDIWTSPHDRWIGHHHTVVLKWEDTTSIDSLHVPPIVIQRVTRSMCSR